MTEQHDFKKEWEAAKKQIMKLSEEAVKLTKKGEVELVKFSKISKLHIDSTTLGIKKEKLYYLIGKEYAASKDPSKSTKLKKLIDELDEIEKGQKKIKTELKSKKSVKKSAKVQKSKETTAE